ncbi:MAG: hypothetical protein IJS94_00085, partial [Clostridia bacterium]|nr:hypothetical protein [Clostridia bacterium]
GQHDLIAKKENIALEKDASLLLARLADGGLRDALSLLESCITGSEGVTVTSKLIEERIGITGNTPVIEMMEAIHDGDAKRAIGISEQIKKSAKNLSSLVEDMAYLARDLLFIKSISDGKFVSDRFFFTEEDKKRAVALAKSVSFDELYYDMDVLEEIQSRVSRYSLNKQLLFELGIIKLCRPSVSDGDTAITARLQKIESDIEKLSSDDTAKSKKQKKDDKNGSQNDSQISLLTEE